MKRVLIWFLMMILCFGLAGCGRSPEPIPESTLEQSTKEVSEEIQKELPEQTYGTVVWMDGLEELIENPENGSILFDVVLRIEMAENWSPEQEAEWLRANGLYFDMEDGLLRGINSGENLRDFPIHERCSYEIELAIRFESEIDPELICLRDEEGCRAFLAENGIEIPEELQNDLRVRECLTRAEVNPHTPLGVSYAVLYDFNEEVRAAVLQYHGLKLQ